MMDIATERQIDARPMIRIWLWVVAILVFAMVIVGGATRLTDSGLSITEWKPILGAIPPLTEADWQAALEKYRQIPEYQVINKGMSLDEFKVIYWWEWGHRFLGRFIGIAFFVPMLWFWATGRLEAALKPRVVALFVLGGLQGALGWYMVMSGLVDRVDVSQYRLSAHLTLATVIFGALIWVALGIGQEGSRRPSGLTGWAASGFVAVILLQTAAGAFVAGLDAGMGYNTWPLMAGAFIPDGLGAMSPAWVNLFENAMTVQFQHRMLAYAIVLVGGAYAVWAWRSVPDDATRISAVALFVVIVCQAALGVWTLLAQVPISLGLLHQGGAMAALAVAIWHLHAAAIQPRPAVPNPSGRALDESQADMA